MKLKCPACGSPIAAQDINIRDMMAVCSHCDNVFPFKAQALRTQRKLKPPEQFAFYETDHVPLHFAFRWNWRTEPAFGFVVMMLVLIFSLFLFAGALSQGQPGGTLAALLMGAFPAYYGLTLLLNSTHYRLDDTSLQVYTTPLWFPYWGSKTLALADLTHVTTEQVFAMPGAAPIDAFYNVYVHTIDEHRILIARAVNYEHAHFIAQEIQAYLGDVQREQDALFELADDGAIDQVDHIDEESGQARSSKSGLDT
jgi:hypothetical protein